MNLNYCVILITLAVILCIGIIICLMMGEMNIKLFNTFYSIKFRYLDIYIS